MGAARRVGRSTAVSRRAEGVASGSAGLDTAPGGAYSTSDFFTIRQRGASAVRPLKAADSPSSDSILSSWLYLATRSDLAGAPVLIWPQFVATARSAIVASSVSPERCDITAVYEC